MTVYSATLKQHNQHLMAKIKMDMKHLTILLVPADISLQHSLLLYLETTCKERPRHQMPGSVRFVTVDPSLALGFESLTAVSKRGVLPPSM
jgi:hypothetical protein